MTLEDFEARLRALLRAASKAKLDPDEVCAIAEHVIADKWDEEGA